MRPLLASVTLLMTGCGPGLVFNNSDLTPDQMSVRATHIFIGVVEKQEFEHWLFLGVPRQSSRDWMVTRRKVHVETVLLGVEPRKTIDVYEIVGMGGGGGTHDSERYLFLTRIESGRYHIVQDYWRCLFQIYSGQHDRLPLDDSHPFWERVGLMTWWPGGQHNFSSMIARVDPGQALTTWRTAKLARGFLRSPEREMRVFGCNTLVLIYLWQDECVQQVFPEHPWPPYQSPVTEADAMTEWGNAVFANDTDKMRLMTAINHPALRREFCRLFTQRFPDDHDNGCPADHPPPATIVTKDGDVPLIGARPRW